MRKEFLSSLIIIPPLLAPERFDQKMTFYLCEDCERFQLNFHDYMSVSLLDMSPIGDIYFIWCFDPYDMGPL